MHRNLPAIGAIKYAAGLTDVANRPYNAACAMRRRLRRTGGRIGGPHAGQADLGGKAQNLRQAGRTWRRGSPHRPDYHTKLLDYATDRHRKDLEEIVAKLHTLEERFGMTSDLFSQKFQRGELGDEEEFFRWDALVEMQRRVAQRLVLLLADSSA